MSISQSQQINSCCSNGKAYTIIYSKKNKEPQISNVCISCFNMEERDKDYSDTLTKAFQMDVVKITCLTCNQDVTESMGCNDCHPKEESS